MSAPLAASASHGPRGGKVQAESGLWSRVFDSDLWYSFRSSPVAVVAAVLVGVCVVSALLAGWIAPHRPFDLATLELSDAGRPPAWLEGGLGKYPVGTDNQGRDVLSLLMYGTRVSLLVGITSVLLSMAIGIALGLLAGFAGGRTDALIMRICDVMLSFPSILVALLVDGVGRALFPQAHGSLSFVVLVVSIALVGWVQYARTIRGCTMIERQKEYVQAARVIGVAPLRIMRRHVLPNVMGPALILATIHVANAIITEATLSYLGVGVPLTSPSLGTLIRIGQNVLFSGQWWMCVFPGLVLMVVAVGINLLGDWLRDALNPRLQ